MNPKYAKKKKLINSAILYSLASVMYCVYVAVAVMIVNLIFNYLFKLIVILPSIVKSKPIPCVNFKLQYLFGTSGIVPGSVVFIIAALLTAVCGRKIVMSSAQKIYSLLPFEITKSTVHGMSRFAKDSEIKKYFSMVGKGDKSDKCGVVLAEDKHHLYIESKNVHTFVIGTTSSGKTQTIVLPSLNTIINCDVPESFVAPDFKGELFENTYYSIKENGYDYYVLNFHDPSRSSQWNPLSIIIRAYVDVADKNGRDFSIAIELANELAAVITDNPKSDPVWPQSAKSLLVAMIMYLVEDGYKRKCLDRLNLYSVYNFFVEFGGKEYKIGKATVNALDQLMSNLPIGHPAKMAYATSKFAVGDMRSSIFATLASNLQIFGDSGIAYMTGGNDVDFRKLTDPDKPCAIYILLPEGKTTRYMLSTLFISQCYSSLVEIAEEYPHRVLPRRVHFMCDELGISPKIPDLDKKIPAARSLGIIFDLIVQSMEQLEDTYGKGAAATIQNNCGNWVYLNSLSVSTNKYVSEMLGSGTLEYSTYSADSGSLLNRTKTDHSKAKPLMSPDELPKMTEGDAIIIKQRCNPVYTTLTPYYKTGHRMADIKTVLEPKPIDLEKILYPLYSIKLPVGSSQPANDKQEEKRKRTR